MDFTEEKTPKGILLKILFKKWQFLAFDRKGRSIYTDKEGKSLLHMVPLIVFLGESLKYKMDYEKEYHLLKIRNDKIILPFIEKLTGETGYIFIPTEKDLDLIPVRMLQVNSVAEMVKEYDVNLRPDYIVIDDEITSNDLIVVMNRYKIDENNILAAVDNTPMKGGYHSDFDEDKRINLNVMSHNPVYLAMVHIRANDLSKINQLLLDFDLNALDIEYILNLIEKEIKINIENTSSDRNIDMLDDLLELYKFYHSLLNKDDEKVNEMVNATINLKQIASYRTMISKVKSQFPGSEEQILYTEYENKVLEKSEVLKSSSSM